MKKTVGEISQLVQGACVGNPDIVITGISDIKDAKEGDIAFIADKKYFKFIDKTLASCVILPKGTEDMVKGVDKAVIFTENPFFAFASIMKVIESELPLPQKGVHPTAIIGKDVYVGKDVSVSSHVVIEDRAEIGDNVIIYSKVHIGHQSKIGSNTIIYPKVTVREKIKIGRRVIIHCGAVIGSDGFGFAHLKGIHHKIPQLGTVIIEDDVEIGARTAIDRATIGKTHVKRGSKIDNLVQISHNVVIGEDNIVVAQVGISGSTVIGKNVILAGQVGVAGHLTIGDNVIVGAKAGVSKSIPDNERAIGIPAGLGIKAKKEEAVKRRLPSISEDVCDLEARIKVLEEVAKEKI